MADTNGLTYYAMNKLLDHVYNKVAYTNVNPIYVGLCTANPTRSATGASCNENPDTNGYARTAIVFGASTTRRFAQSGNVVFPTVTTNPWSTITHWAIFDSGTHGAGNCLAYGPFAASKTPAVGATPVILDGTIYVEAGANTVDEGTGISTYWINRMLNLMFYPGGTLTAPTSIQMVLSHTIIADGDSASMPPTWTEVTGTGYARVTVNPNSGASPKWSLASNGAITNDADLVFDAAAGADWTEIVASAAYASNWLAIGNYDNANVEDFTPVVGQPIKILAGDCDISLT